MEPLVLALIGLILAYFFLQHGFLIPLNRITRFTAFRFGELTAAHNVFAAIAKDIDAHPETGDNQPGTLVYSTMVFATPAALCFLVFAGPPANYLAVIPLLDAALIVAGFAVQSRFEKLQEAGVAPTAALAECRHVLVACPQCRATFLVEPERSGTVHCPGCEAGFAVSTKPIRWPAWIAGALVIAAWIASVRPWQANIASPFTIVAWSAYACLFCVVVPHILRWRQLDRQAVPIDAAALDDLARASAIVAITSLGFALINYHLWTLDNTPHAFAFLSEIRDWQKRTHELLETWERRRIALWEAGAVCLVLVVLIRQGQARAFSRLVAANKAAKTAIEALTVFAITVGSFAVAGAQHGATMTADLNATAFRLDALAKEHEAAISSLRRAVERVVAREAARRVIEISTAVPPDCRDAESGNGTSCPHYAADSLDRAIHQADTLTREWPATLRPALPEPGRLEQARRLSAALQTWANPGTAQPSRLEPALIALPLAGVAAATVAIEHVDATPTTSPMHEQIKVIVGLVVGGLLDAMPAVPAQFEDAAGKLSGAFAETVTSAMREPFEAEISDVVRDLTEACGHGGSDCVQEVNDRIAAAARDPRAAAVGRRLAAFAGPVMSRWFESVTAMRTANAASEAMLKEAAEPLLMGERKGVWGELRARWRADTLPPHRQDETADSTTVAHAQARNLVRRGETQAPVDQRIRALMAIWDEIARARAVKLLAEGKTAPAQEWDFEFLAFLNDAPFHAATFGFILLNDPVARARLAPPGGVATIADAYLAFARAVRAATPDAAAVIDVVAENDVAGSPAFHDPALPLSREQSAPDTHRGGMGDIGRGRVVVERPVGFHGR